MAAATNTGSVFASKAWVQMGSIHRQLAEYDQAEARLQLALDLAIRHLAKTARLYLTPAMNWGILFKYTARIRSGRSPLSGCTRPPAGPPRRKHQAALRPCYHNLGGLEHAPPAICRGRAVWPGKPGKSTGRLLGEDHPTTLADDAAYAGLLDGLERYTRIRADLTAGD